MDTQETEMGTLRKFVTKSLSKKEMVGIKRAIIKVFKQHTYYMLALGEEIFYASYASYFIVEVLTDMNAEKEFHP